MRYVLTVSLCLLAPILLTGCDGRSSPETAQAAEPASAAGAPPWAAAGTDTAAAATVVATMRRVYDGFVSHDATAINAAVPTSGLVYVGPDGMTPVTSPDGTTEMVKQCAVKRYAMDSVQRRAPAPDLMLLSFKLTIDETCGGQRSPSPDYVLSTWQRQDGTWRAIAFSATPAARAR